MKIVFATRNEGKLQEVRDLLPQYEVLSLKDISYDEEIAEPYETFEENAHAKASKVYQHCGLATIADDSGLCVAALKGAPGVHSAYYGGLHGDDQKNIKRLLCELQGVEQRNAYFITVLCWVEKDKAMYFEGRCEGRIALEPVGANGFGYDPIFIPNGYERTFAEISKAEKNKLSHRAIALQKLSSYLKALPK